ncbi:FAD-dependent monooxygenase [Streptomyces sp. JJ66]|uniref:FAD-dependent oxidoreductase n=1 Tax=Streptomyces sp. JJ66 TaxID=2803843 RepID=UPI001C599380|nr:FAD-dependent oxidoreductase [Streptomyces sp. JJ66]MBW1604586.1 FAD-dependent monooxygenase [Streptomyces sp. JJ66]
MPKAVICGAGITGLALAHQLDTTGWDVVVLEKAPAPRPQGYMIDFFGPGYDAAEAMGVLPRLRELSYTVQEAAYVDAHGRRRAGLDYARFSRSVGGRVLSIMRPDLEQALREHLSADVELRFGTSPTAVEDTGDTVHVTLTDGTVERADLLVGADGVHSTVRRLAFGPEHQYLRHLGFHTAAFTFEDPELHARLGPRFTLTDTVNRQLGCYGLRDGRVAAFAVHRTRDTALPDDPRAALRRAYGTLGWAVPRALDRCPPASDLYYDHVAQTLVPQWTRGRITLLGDAAYAVSLLAGQGASLGVAGATRLAHELAATPDLPTALARFEHTWRPTITHRQHVARRTARWFLPASRPQLLLRRLFLHATALPAVANRLTKSIAGQPVSGVTPH